MKPRLMQAVSIELQPSMLLLGLLCAISMACCAILAQLPLAFAIKCGLIALVIISSTYFAMRDALLRLPNSWKKVEVSAQGALKLTNNKGQIFEPTLAASSLIHRIVTILNVERSGLNWRLPPVILFTNQENHEALRKLRVWLRWWKHQEDLSAA